ncbi:MAG: hypothetical protein WBK19_15600 [Azonexus sp.]
MNRNSAAQRIRQIFANYISLRQADSNLVQALNDGKLYELFVLSHVIDDLRRRGFTLIFQPNVRHPSALQFKASPGRLATSDSHFTVTGPDGTGYWLFVDIEFDSLGHFQSGANDNSRRHEIDIVVCTTDLGYPRHDEIALGVECKAWANFTKGLVKEALGVRRELSLLDSPQSSILSSAQLVTAKVSVPASPASEFWLAFIDPKGLNYAQSPAVYGVELKHLQP